MVLGVAQIPYSVEFRLDCEPCGEAMYHVVSSRLPRETPDKRWSFHLFRCENCGAEKAFYSTMADPREKVRASHECRYCSDWLLESDEGIGHDPLSDNWYHIECARAQPPPKAISP